MHGFKSCGDKRAVGFVSGSNMGNRTGTYVAFDARGIEDPARSDMRYYDLMRAWDQHDGIEFSFVNSHDKTYAVRDSSSDDTLRTRIRERLSLSKNMVIIVSSATRDFGSFLSYEIEQAVDEFNLPLIVVYPGYRYIQNVAELCCLWPPALAQRIASGVAKAIHVPFNRMAIQDAIRQFSVNAKYPGSSMSYYSKEAYRTFGVEISG